MERLTFSCLRNSIFMSQTFKETKLESNEKTREQSYRETKLKLTKKLGKKVTEEQT